MTAQADALMGIFGFKRVEGKAMDKVSETRRGLFEAWWISEGLTLNDPTHGRYTVTTQAGWMGFNAALDAVLIELPYIGDYIDRHGQGLNCDEFVTAVRDAIESTSLGIKIK